MHLSDITDALINRKFEQKIVARGFEYFHNGAVDNTILRGDTVTAEVEGSEYDPYHVLVTLGAGDIENASCTCPYDAEWGGWCKHIAAVLLLCAHQPENVEVATPLDALLVALDRDALEALLRRLARTDAEVAEKIAAEAERLLLTPAAKAAKSKFTRSQPTPDARSLQNKLRQILREPDEPMTLRQAKEIRHRVSDLFQEQVERRLNTGNAADALLALDPLTEEYVNHWYDVSETDDLGTVFPYIGSLWERALAASAGTLTAPARKAWKKRLSAWETELSEDYGVGDTFIDAILLL